jgi:hypothetical protein
MHLPTLIENEFLSSEPPRPTNNFNEFVHWHLVVDLFQDPMGVQLPSEFNTIDIQTMIPV